MIHIVYVCNDIPIHKSKYTVALSINTAFASIIIKTLIRYITNLGTSYSEPSASILSLLTDIEIAIKLLMQEISIRLFERKIRL